MSDPNVPIKLDPIKLDQFLKWSNAAQTGGEAKLLIQSGQVCVNGEIETRRGRKLVAGDRVSVGGQMLIVRNQAHQEPESDVS